MSEPSNRPAAASGPRLVTSEPARHGRVSVETTIDAALDLAELVAKRVIRHGIDPLAVGLAANLQELIDVVRERRPV